MKVRISARLEFVLSYFRLQCFNICRPLVLQKAHETSKVAKLVSSEKWQARVDLAAAYRFGSEFGWDDLVFTHISARVPWT